MDGDLDRIGYPDYFPLTYSLFKIWRAIWGPSPLAFHGLNLSLHATSVLLLLAVLRRLTLPGAWLGAALFAVHPVNVATVGWISEIKNTLSLALLLTATLLLLQRPPAGSPYPRRPWLFSLGTYLLSLLAKTSGVSVPLVWAGLQKRGRGIRRTFPPVIPDLVLAVVLGTATLWFQRHHAAGMMETGIPPWDRVIRAFWATGFYLRCLFLPTDLSMLHQEATPSGWSLSWGFAGGAILLTLLCLRLHGRAWVRAWLGAFAAYLLLIAPVLGLVPMYFHRFAPVAEQWLYLPGIPILALIGWLGSQLPTRLRIALATVVLGGLTLLTMARCRELADPLTLWGGEARRHPVSAKAREWLGVALAAQHRDGEAMSTLREAIRLDPDSPEATLNLAAITARNGAIDEALSVFEVGENRWPALADVPAVRGEILLLAGKPDQAAESFGKALTMAPAMPKACLGMARAAYAMERPDLMIPPLQSLLAANPDHPVALGMLGAALASTGHPEEAREAFLHALRLHPGDPQLLQNLRTLEETAHPPGSSTP